VDGNGCVYESEVKETEMREIVSVSPAGHMIGLNFNMAFGVKTNSIERGVYVIDRIQDDVLFTPEYYAPRTLKEITYQLPMPEFAV
jgi:hypothetical protein